MSVSFKKLGSAGLLCSLVACLIYLNTLDCGIVFDDEPAIKKNQDLRPHTPWSNLLRHDFWGSPMDSPTSHKSYRPLCVATFRLNYLVHELQPMGYHLVNVLLHSAVCWLYVQLCGSVFGEVWPAVIAGLLFAVHPVHVEAVAGLVGRTELLSGLFYIGAFFAYCRAIRRNGSTVSAYGWLLATILLCVCSVLSKEQGITVVAVCLVYEFFVFRKVTIQSFLKTLLRRPQNSPAWFKSFLLRTLLLFAFTVAFLAGRIWLMQGGPTLFHQSINPPLFMESPYRQLNWLYLCFVNSWLLLNPFRLCADWRFGAIHLITSLTDQHNALTIATFLVFTLLTLFGLLGSTKEKTVTLFGLSLLILPYIPASNLFFPVGFVVAERVLYLPSMGFCFLVGYGFWCLVRSAKTKFVKLLLSLLIVSLAFFHAARTMQRNRDWESKLTLYTSGMRFNPRNGVMISNLGIEHAHMKNYSFAEQLYRTSIEVAPEHSRSYANLGGLMEALKRYDEAEWALRKAIEFGAIDNTPAKVVQTYVFMIEKVIMRNESRFGEALEVCEQALQEYPNSGPLFTTKGNVLLKLNRVEEAVTYLEAVVQSNLAIADAHYHLGVAYSRLGRRADATRSFREALKVDPGHKSTLLELGKVLLVAGKPGALQEAEALLLQAQSVDKRNADVAFTLAKLYSTRGNNDKSVEYLQRGLQLSPKDTGALFELGRLHFKTKKYGEAVKVLRRLNSLDPTYPKARELLTQAEKLSKISSI